MSVERAWSIATPRHWRILEDPDAGVWLLIDTDTNRVREFRPPRRWLAWWEWETASKGRRQMQWSQRPKDPEPGSRQELWCRLLDARGRDRDDAEIAADDLGGVVLGEIERSSWYQRMVYRPQWLADVLEAAEQGGEAGVSAWMAEHGVEWAPAENREVGPVLVPAERPGADHD